MLEESHDKNPKRIPNTMIFYIVLSISFFSLLDSLIVIASNFTIKEIVVDSSCNLT